MDDFGEKLMHELRLIDEQRYRRIKIFGEQHKDDDVFESQENLDARDLFNDWEEEELDDMNYTAIRLAKKRFRWKRLLEREATVDRRTVEKEDRLREIEEELKEKAAKLAEMEGEHGAT